MRSAPAGCHPSFEGAAADMDDAPGSCGLRSGALGCSTGAGRRRIRSVALSFRGGDARPAPTARRCLGQREPKRAAKPTAKAAAESARANLSMAPLSAAVNPTLTHFARSAGGGEAPRSRHDGRRERTAGSSMVTRPAGAHSEVAEGQGNANSRDHHERKATPVNHAEHTLLERPVSAPTARLPNRRS